MINVIPTPDSPVCTLPLSHAVQAGNFVFVSGQASVDETGQIVGDSFANEMRRSIENVSKALAGAGLDLTHVVQSRCYVRDEKDLAEFNQIYREFFSEPYPTRTTLTGCLPEIIKFEIDVTAWCDHSCS